MKYPIIEIRKDKLLHNTKVLVDMCSKKGIDIAGVTKVFCGHPGIAKIFIDGGVSLLADSRLKNIIRLNELNIKKMLLRIPMLSELEDVVDYVDISLNSEYETIRKLSEIALRKGRIHQIILMVDLGDLREGVWHENAVKFVESIMEFKNISLQGIGLNMNCYGGVIPSSETMLKLLEIRDSIESIYDMKLNIISGGNSGALHLIINNKIPSGINQFRLGEALTSGIERGYDQRIENTFDDCFIFKAEIVELKKKPSKPIGEIGKNSFGESPIFVDKGDIDRAILACGKQDVKIEGLIPLDNRIEVLGGSSDHMILDLTNCADEYRLGDVVSFKMDYGALLTAFTSEYVGKLFVCG